MKNSSITNLIDSHGTKPKMSQMFCVNYRQTDNEEVFKINALLLELLHVFLYKDVFLDSL